MKDRDVHIWKLEDALHQAIWTVEFLHGCLTNPDLYRYDFPEQTEENLRVWRALTPPPALCAHSKYIPGCAACESRKQRYGQGMDQ